MIYIVGDLHIRKDKPFYDGGRKTLDYLLDTMEEGSHLVQLGDLFHKSKPTPSEYELFFKFVDKLEQRKIQLYLLAGNHDYNYNLQSYSIDPIGYAKKIYNAGVIEIEGIRFFCLAWEFGNSFKKRVEKKYLEEYKSEIENSDYLLYHFADETVMFGSEYAGIDISGYQKVNPNIQYIGGDIHKPDSRYIGTPYKTRYDEKDNTHRIFKIDRDKVKQEVLVPSFIDYVSVNYGDELQGDRDSILLEISDAPSVELAYERYRDYYIHSVSLSTVGIRGGVSTEIRENNEGNDIKGMFNSFLDEGDYDVKTLGYLKEVFSLT